MKRLRSTVEVAWHALVQVATGPEPAPVAGPAPAAVRRVGYAALGAVALLSAVVNATHGDPATLWRTALAVAVVLPLLLAVRRPLLGWRISWLALLLVPLVPATWWGGWPWGPPQILALLVVFCAAALRGSPAELWWMWGLSLLPWGAWLIADIPDLNGPACATMIFTAVVLALESIGARLRTQRALDTQTVRTDTERARRAVLEERARIARELHDVVAHHLSLIAVRAETAPYRLGELPPAARDEFGALSGVAREALTEMRRLLGVLRQDQVSGLAPQPDLSELPALVEAARRAGVDVELSAPAGLGGVPAGVGLCAYRIVQESLSNATRHAPGASVTVAVELGPAEDAPAVQLRVVNGPGAAAAAPVRPTRGLGLTGMRERVALLGGTLSAGPTPVGGFAVDVVLPLGERR